MGQNQSASPQSTTASPQNTTSPEAVYVPSQSINISKKMIKSNSLVAGSPLATLDQFTPFGEGAIPVQIRNKYSQPHGEASYRNSSKIAYSIEKGEVNETLDETLVSVIVTWNKGGQNVAVAGSFNGWEKLKLTKSVSDFSAIIDLPPGKHTIRFWVDNEWKCSDDLPTATDSSGNLVNFLNVSNQVDFMKDGFEELSTSVGANRPDTPVEDYKQDIPDYLERRNGQNKQHPPLLPAHFNKILLNSKSISEDPTFLPVPNHVSVNHLYACSIRDGVMAVATTFRYREKVCFFELVYYDGFVQTSIPIRD
jgi:5'-AMP-activated protein kinase regulatory beta subunit